MEGTTIYQSSNCRVYRCSYGTLIKEGSKVTQDEALAMSFLHRLNLPVPEVYSVKPTEDGVAIEMQCLDGVELEVAWPSLTNEGKKSIAQQLRRFLNELRAASRPECLQHQISSISSGPIQDIRWIETYSGGPFTNDSELKDFVLSFRRQPPDAILDAFHQNFPRSEQIVFTHGDLCPRNIFVKGDKLIGVIDWETAAWMPAYWEYVKFFGCSTSHRDWKNYARHIFDEQHLTSLLYYEAVSRWHGR